MPPLSLAVTSRDEDYGEPLSIRERMQRFNASGMGARGSALLIAPSGGEGGPSAPPGAGPSSSTPNQRNRALRATSPIDTAASYISESGGDVKLSDVAAISVPRRFKDAKQREQKSLRSREDVLKISRRVLDVHTLDNDRFQTLENKVAKPARSPRSTYESEEYEEMQQYNPGVLPC